MNNTGATAFTDSALLTEIENLQLSARTLAMGALAGIHRSRNRGSSIEFSEHKVYSQGDEIRHIDWRAFAKTDRYHVKQFEDETNLRVELLIDHSGSMAFAHSERPSKLFYARQLAAALAYLALRQNDATGLTTFAQTISDALPARASSAHLMEILKRLAALRADGPTGVGKCVGEFALTHARKSVVIVFSDLFDPNPALLDGFRMLAARGHDVVVFHLLDQVEIDFNYDTPTLFACMEDNRQVFIHPRTLRQAFMREMQAFRERMARTLGDAGIHYQSVLTHEPPAQVLGAFLRAREGRR